MEWALNTLMRSVLPFSSIYGDYVIGDFLLAEGFELLLVLDEQSLKGLEAGDQVFPT